MSEIYGFSAPGRTEISGNHTDHQHGYVLATAVNPESVAEASFNHSDFFAFGQSILAITTPLE